jgi:glyoxylase-like metal-dependent hydrolase (beta-lactamase superfamily II)
MHEVSVRLLRAGHCRHPEVMTIRGGSWRPAVFPALATLLVHPEEGPILFDTGYDPAFLAATEPFPERLYRWLTPPSLAPGEDAASQLLRLGTDPGSVAHLILSHFHADHIAGTHRFSNAKIHCSRAGYARASAAGRVGAVAQGVLKALIPPDFAARARFFEDAPRVPLAPDLAPFTDGADILGDGSVLAVELPGHCPGHWGLLVADAEAGPHFLVADAAWSTRAIEENRPPPLLTGAFLGSARAGRETLARLHALWRRNPDVRLTPSHCPRRAEEAECADRS